MCNYHQLPEYDRLESVIQLIRVSDRANNSPIDLYRLHDYLLLPDELEDEVDEANDQVGLAFGYGLDDDDDERRDRGEVEVEMEDEGEVEVERAGVERDEIKEFLDGVWPSGSDVDMNDGEGSGSTTDQLADDDGRNGEIEVELPDHINTDAPVVHAAAATGGGALSRQNTPVSAAAIGTNTGSAVPRAQAQGDQEQIPATTQQQNETIIIPHIRFTIRGLR